MDRLTIREALADEILAKGLRFTLDDLSTRLKMSKKTLYKHHSSKEELLRSCIEYIYTDIHNQQELILMDLETNPLEKLRAILTVEPPYPQILTSFKMDELESLYPHLKELVLTHLEADWEKTFDLLEQAAKAQLIRSISPALFRQVYLGAVESILGTDYLTKNKITYKTMLNQLVDLLLMGLGSTQ